MQIFKKFFSSKIGLIRVYIKVKFYINQSYNKVNTFVFDCTTIYILNHYFYVSGLCSPFKVSTFLLTQLGTRRIFPVLFLLTRSTRLWCSRWSCSTWPPPRSPSWVSEQFRQQSCLHRIHLSYRQLQCLHGIFINSSFDRM